jgi:hypothetical protein
MKQIFIFVIIAILCGCYSKEPEDTGFEGKPMPSFKILLIDSITYMDTKNIPKGKPVVLLYIGTHCPYSRAQIEEIMNEMNSLKNIQFYVFTESPFKELKKLSTHYRLDKYANIKAGYDYTHFFRNHFKITGVPYVAIYGKDKKLKKAFEGKIYSKEIKKSLE